MVLCANYLTQTKPKHEYWTQPYMKNFWIFSKMDGYDE